MEIDHPRPTKFGHGNFFMTIKLQQKLALVVFLIALSGCLSEYEFNSYIDKDEKGKQVFVKDLNNCRQYLNIEKRSNEGSERSGEKLIREKNLLRTCMENKNWILQK
jgi:hypothetical protein